jgi:magnesium and cobalt exporter, CNNM family
MLIQFELLIAAGLVAVLLILSILDFGLAGVNKMALRRITESVPRQGNALKESLLDARAEVLMAIHISIQTILIAIAVILTDVSLRYVSEIALALVAAAGATVILVLVFRQLVPRAIALRNPEAVLARLVSVLGIPYFILRPIVRLIMAILNLFQGWESPEQEVEEEASDEEIQAFIDVGQEEGILEQDEGVMIHSIVQFGDKLALEVMTPRPQVVSVDISSSLEEVIRVVLDSRHSRLPVYRGELDNVEGIVHERDLLRLRAAEDEPENLRAILRPAHFVPETKPVDDLLEELKAHGQQLTLVVDEYGGISGLITIEDLVEEIVGEINDDPDAVTTEVVEEGSGSWLIPAGTELDALRARLGRSLFPDTECTTLGGAVVELFGRMPSSGEWLRHEDLQIEIVEVDRKSVKSVRLRLAAPGLMPGAGRA